VEKLARTGAKIKNDLICNKLNYQDIKLENLNWSWKCQLSIRPSGMLNMTLQCNDVNGRLDALRLRPVRKGA
jgi:hypothetical protein